MPENNNTPVTRADFNAMIAIVRALASIVYDIEDHGEGGTPQSPALAKIKKLQENLNDLQGSKVGDDRDV